LDVDTKHVYDIVIYIYNLYNTYKIYIVLIEFCWLWAICNPC